MIVNKMYNIENFPFLKLQMNVSILDPHVNIIQLTLQLGLK